MTRSGRYVQTCHRVRDNRSELRVWERERGRMWPRAFLDEWQGRGKTSQWAHSPSRFSDPFHPVRASQHLVQDAERLVHRLLVVRHGHEVVRRALEEESPRRAGPRHLTREILAREMQKAHLRNPTHARHHLAVLVVQPT